MQTINFNQLIENKVISEEVRNYLDDQNKKELTKEILRKEIGILEEQRYEAVQERAQDMVEWTSQVQNGISELIVYMKKNKIDKIV